ncbi:MAG: hypothetical protein K9J13_03405 [Saprospiraceae bacterium]|nr:hypothetical protein [Saprospiraceae bacterium]
MIKFFVFVKKSNLRIFLLIVLLIVFHAGFTQSLNWIDSYQLKLNVGVRVKPFSPAYGVVGGFVIQDKEKPLGINLGISYLMPRYFIDTSIYVYYFDLTYRLLFIKQKPFIVGLGIEKPSYHFNPYHYCRYCFFNNLALSLQQQIWITNIEFRISKGIGNKNSGWFLRKYYGFSLGINYSFDLSRRKSKLNLN